jgi:hypothetical protein
MKRNTQVLLFFFLGGIILFLFVATHPLCVEHFGATSPGTMVQLQTSHVPTQRDVDYFNFVLPKVVRKDITNMTGEDPGDLRPTGIPIGGAYVLGG